MCNYSHWQEGKAKKRNTPNTLWLRFVILIKLSVSGAFKKATTVITVVIQRGLDTWMRIMMYMITTTKQFSSNAACYIVHLNHRSTHDAIISVQPQALPSPDQFWDSNRTCRTQNRAEMNVSQCRQTLKEWRMNSGQVWTTNSLHSAYC